VGSATIFEPPAGIAGFDDVAMMGQAIEHGGCHFGVTEHLRPIGECQIGGDQQRRVLVKSNRLRKIVSGRIAVFQRVG
jgi:hypothetical protein